MIVTPAVDLKEGRCVQLVGGRPEDERVSRPDPVAEALRWARDGFRTLHVVDLDAALGTGDNLAVIERILGSTDARTQVGGGIRSDETADRLLDAGAERVIVGTRALADPAWRTALANRYPGRVTLALDTRDGRVLTKGWTEETGLEVTTFLPSLEPLPLAGVLCTDVGREGRMGGIDREACARVVEASPHPIWISGGVTTEAEIAYLEEIGAAGVVLGMAIYTGALDRGAIARRWGGGSASEESDGKDGP